MNRYVLDSYAILAFLYKEPKWEYVQNLIRSARDKNCELYMSIINMAEVRYTVIRRKQNSSVLESGLDSLPITFLSADEYIDDVIQLKAKYSVSIADCFGAAAAVRLDCPIVTGDPEFKKFGEEVKIDWLSL